MKVAARAGFGIVLVTCASKEEAEKLARGIVESRLAACVNVVPAVESFFWWEGKIDVAKELLLIIKTRRSAFAALERYVKAHHSYQVPEVVFLPIQAGHRPYMNWLAESMQRG